MQILKTVLKTAFVKIIKLNNYLNFRLIKLWGIRKLKNRIFFISYFAKSMLLRKSVKKIFVKNFNLEVKDVSFTFFKNLSSHTLQGIKLIMDLYKS